MITSKRRAAINLSCLCFRKSLQIKHQLLVIKSCTVTGVPTSIFYINTAWKMNDFQMFGTFWSLRTSEIVSKQRSISNHVSNHVFSCLSINVTTLPAYSIPCHFPYLARHARNNYVTARIMAAENWGLLYKPSQAKSSSWLVCCTLPLF